VIELLKDGHRDDHLMLGEGGNGGRVMQQHIGIQDVDLPVCSVELGDFVGLGCSQRHIISSQNGKTVRTALDKRGMAPLSA
jgi:hypothetical protein